MKKWLVFTLGLILLTASTLYFKPFAKKTVPVSAQSQVAGAVTESIVDETPLVAKINDQRAINGLSRLKSDRTLDAIARKRATDMIVQGEYSHKMSDGLYYDSLLKKVGLTTGYSCENLDLVTDEAGLVSVENWLKSTAGHKECMLNSQAKFTGLSVPAFDHVNMDGIDQMLYVVVAISSETSL